LLYGVSRLTSLDVSYKLWDTNMSSQLCQGGCPQRDRSHPTFKIQVSLIVSYVSG